MNSENTEKLRKRFGPFLAQGLVFDVPDERLDLLWQMFSDIENFMSRSPEYQYVAQVVRVNESDGSIWIGDEVKPRGRKRREKGHSQWLYYRLKEIIGQSEWDSRYETVAQQKELK